MMVQVKKRVCCKSCSFKLQFDLDNKKSFRVLCRLTSTADVPTRWYHTLQRTPSQTKQNELTHCPNKTPRTCSPTNQKVHLLIRWWRTSKRPWNNVNYKSDFGGNSVVNIKNPPNDKKNYHHSFELLFANFCFFQPWLIWYVQMYRLTLCFRIVDKKPRFVISNQPKNSDFRRC